jgi:hypothetical protein
LAWAWVRLRPLHLEVVFHRAQSRLRELRAGGLCVRRVHILKNTVLGLVGARRGTRQFGSWDAESICGLAEGRLLLGPDRRVRHHRPRDHLVPVVAGAGRFALDVPEVVAVVVRAHPVSLQTTPHRGVHGSLPELGSLLVSVRGRPKRGLVHGVFNK